MSNSLRNMSDARWKPWVIGIAVVLGVGGWFWWQGENPDLVGGEYSCEGHTVQTDGARALVNASAEVSGRKIQAGPTGTDIVAGHRVTTWRDVKKTTRSEFLVQIHPTPEIVDYISEPFWITCSLN